MVLYQYDSSQIANRNNKEELLVLRSVQSRYFHMNEIPLNDKSGMQKLMILVHTMEFGRHFLKVLCKLLGQCCMIPTL